MLIDGADSPNGIVVDGSGIVSSPGESADGFGIVDGGGGSTIRGLTIQGFVGNAIAIVDDATHPCHVSGVVIDGNMLAGNGGNGVVIRGAGSDETTLVASGGHAVVNNTISNNGGAGILVINSARNLISGNHIVGNGAGAIDLGGDGPTPNDPGDADIGANFVQNYPVLYQAYSSVQTVVLNGLLNSRPGAYEVQFFASPSCDSGPLVLLNAVPYRVTITPDAAASYAGTAYFSAALPVVGDASTYVGQFVRATATDAAHNTSELSSCMRVPAPPTTIPGLLPSCSI